MTPRLIKITAGITVQSTSERFVTWEEAAGSVVGPVSRYFQIIQPKPSWAAVKEIPTTTIVIMNWRSRAGACSEIASGNHHLPATNSSTESSVIIQIITARTRPIGYISFDSDLFLSARLHRWFRKSVQSVDGFYLRVICGLTIQHHQDKQQRQVEY